MATLTKAVFDGILSYNEWAIKKARGYDPIKSYNDLVGVFYNKLLDELLMISGMFDSKRQILSTLSVCEIKPTFGEYNVITQLTFGLYKCNYASAKKEKFICELNEAAKSIDFNDLRNPDLFEIKQFVNNVQNYKTCP
jgi:hypothetical protein